MSETIPAELRDRVCILSGTDGRGKIGFVRSIGTRRNYKDGEPPIRTLLVCDGMAETFEWAFWVDDSDVAVVSRFSERK